MKAVLKLFIALVAIALPIEALANADFLSRYEQNKLPKIKPPHVSMQVLDNGMRLYLLEDHTIPVIKVGAIIRTGSLFDPPQKVGLASLASSLMRSGGVGSMSPESFDKALDDLGASLSTAVSHEMGIASLEILSEDMQEGLSLFFKMLFEPQFNKKRLNIARQKILESLIRQDDDPQMLADYRFRQLVYGKQSPWARRPSKATLSIIDEEDIKQFHKNFFKADNIILIASGDFKYDNFLDAVSKLTANAPTGKVIFPNVAPVALEFEPKEERIIRPLTQAFIRMGHLSIKRHNPDKFALFLADDILGASGFKSRLIEDVRVRRGMAYSIWSSVMPETDYGLFSIGVNTRASNANNVIEIVKRHLKRMAVDGDVTDEEMDFAKQSILRRLIFQFDMPYKVVNQEATFYFYGYPKDYWKIYRDKIAASTLADVNRAAAKYFKPDDLEILIVGPRSVTSNQ
ncbi:MAG: pitrilysin family protein [Pseudomonadota bacterium]